MSYEVFDTIFKAEGKKSIEDRYTSEQLQSKIVTWYVNRYGNKKSQVPTSFVNTKMEYRVFNNHEELYDELDLTMEHERLYHEVVIGKQKLKFDIDMKNDPFDFKHVVLDTPAVNITANMDFNLIVNYFVERIKQQFFYTYEIDLNPSDIIITDSSKDGVKYSSHIIVNNYYVSSYKQAAEFTLRLCSIITKQYKEILDLGVNKSTQNFRLALCHNGDGRYKTIMTNHNFTETLITNIDNCTLLPDIIEGAVEKDNSPKNVPSDEDIATAVKLCADTTVGHTYRKQHNNTIAYNRIKPTKCDICNEIHHNDNSMMVIMLPNDKTIKLYQQCRQYNTMNKLATFAEKSRLISEFVPLNSSVLHKPGNWSTNAIKQAIEGTLVASDKILTKNITQNECNEQYRNNLILENYEQQLRYSESSLRDFELVKTLIVKAAMKMGKTKTLKRYIDSNFAPTQLKKPVIRIVSFRQTFSNNVKEKFPDFTLYSDVAGELSHDRLIVQIESLHRIKVFPGGSPPDLLILDECESIFEQFNAGLIKNIDCFSKFLYLLKYSVHVVCMDALVSDRTFNILDKLRPDPQIFYHNNVYRNAIEDHYNITHSYDSWIQELLTAIKEGHRIAMPISSLKIANETKAIIAEKYPELRVKLYSSETSIAEKKEHFANVKLYWSQYDVILYTPTISAGVSFEEKHFTKIFAYFTDKSCPVETCIQMLGRVRDVATKSYYICLAATGNSLPCTVDSIKHSLQNSRSALYSETATSSAITHSYDDCGNMIIHKTPFYYVWLENTRMINISKNYFITKLIGILRDFGSSIEQFGTASGDDVPQDIEDIALLKAKVKEDIKNELIARISNAKDLLTEEVEEIRATIDAQIDLTQEQQNDYDRFILRQDYNYTTEKHPSIPEKFIATYYPKPKRKLYKNISKIFVGETHEDALGEIQREERSFNRYYMENQREQNDLAKTYMFTKHNIAISLIKACGWKALNDQLVIEELPLSRRMTQDGFTKLINQASIEFGIKEPFRIAMSTGGSVSIITNTYTKFISKILTELYGVTIKHTISELDDKQYKLKGMRIFKYEFGADSYYR